MPGQLSFKDIERRTWSAYGLALASCWVAWLVGQAVFLVRPDEGVAALFFIAAVAVSGWHGGRGPALFATALGALALDWFFEPTPYTLEVTDVRTLLGLAAFLAVAGLLGSLNARLRQALLRAEKAVRAREELLETVSHDLRTPLTTIKMSLSTLRNEGVPLPNDTRQKLIASSEAEVERLVRLVTGTLTLLRIEHGIVPNDEWNALAEVASAVLDRCVPLLGTRPVSFNVSDTLPLARFDAILLDQALTALLENVAAHTPPDVPVAVEGDFDRGQLQLAVSDGGPGIPREERDRVFTKYERLDHRGPGIGLGLAIVKGAMAAQGGQARVEDSPLGGARFVLTLPVRQEAA
jgi:two-component system sensor histidine kinase KdpD